MSNIIVKKSNIRGSFIAPAIEKNCGDYSFAGAFLLRAALDSSVICENLSTFSQQSGIAVLDIIKNLGAAVKRSGDAVNVRGAKLKGITVDISACSTLAPMLALTSLFASGKTRIRGFEGCHSLQSIIIENLRLLGARFEYNSNDLWIWSQKSPEHAVLFANGHPYIALALILISTYTKDDTVIRDIDGLLQVYPDFPDIFSALGGEFTLTDSLIM